jgi:thiosulfate/3-mercaptopyruvate sulfurtransferase
VGGGLIEGHLFKKTPSMTRNCTACHGSRVGNEFLGKNEDILADVHFRQGRMKCTDCHTGVEMHGDVEGIAGSLPDHRYDGPQAPRCDSCHPNVGSDDIQMHQMHGEKLSCQVCHSVTYSSCDGCHVALSEDTGNPFFRTEGTYKTFMIGRNARQDENRPYEYVPVRHIPIAPTSYDYYGDNLLPNFDALPTWAYATPHNIQRNTPQNESCAACHGNPELFLTADKVTTAELAANQPVIVEAAPGPVGEMGTSSSLLRLPDHHAGFPICLTCHLERWAPHMPDNHEEHTDAICTSCHSLPETVDELFN